MAISIHTLSTRLRLAFPPDPEMVHCNADDCLEEAIHVLKLLEGPNALAGVSQYLEEQFGGAEYCNSVASQLVREFAA